MTDTIEFCQARVFELRTADEIEAERQHYRMRCEALWPGWALVPIVPTQAMHEAFTRETRDQWWTLVDVMRVVCDAAPASPA